MCLAYEASQKNTNYLMVSFNKMFFTKFSRRVTLRNLTSNVYYSNCRQIVSNLERVSTLFNPKIPNTVSPLSGERRIFHDGHVDFPKPRLYSDLEHFMQPKSLETDLEALELLSPFELADLEQSFLHYLLSVIDRPCHEWRALYFYFENFKDTHLPMPGITDLCLFHKNNKAFFAEASVRQLKDCMDQFEGQGNRGLLVKSLSKAYQVSPSTTQVTVEILDLLQNASVTLDDLGDGSLERRGGPAVYRLIGISNTFLLFKYLLSKALYLSDLQSKNIRPFLKELIDGQLLDHELSQGLLALNRMNIKQDVVFNALMTCNTKKTSPLFIKILTLLGIQDKVSIFEFQQLTSYFAKYGSNYQNFDDIKDLSEDSKRRRVFGVLLYLGVIKDNLEQMQEIISTFQNQTKVYAVLSEIQAKQYRQFEMLNKD